MGIISDDGLVKYCFPCDRPCFVCIISKQYNVVRMEELRMKQNKYDDNIFFNKYSNMGRSEKGLEGAGEWHELKKMLPNFKNKRVLDLGCGFGWHCRFAIENGAKPVENLLYNVPGMLDELRRPMMLLVSSRKK